MNTSNNTPSADVDQRMQDLGIVGFHALKPVSDAEHMTNLDEVERIINGRKLAVHQGLQKEQN